LKTGRRTGQARRKSIAGDAPLQFSFCLVSLSCDVLVGGSIKQGANKLKVTKAKKNGKSVRREWTKADIKELKAHSKARTPVAKISKETRRTVGALRQKALHLGIGLGHQR
jgi:hypothetical protein